MGGRAAACQVHPDKSCRAMLKGIRFELANSGIIHACKNDMMAISADNWAPEEYIEEYYDNISSNPLDTKLVKSAHADEMKKVDAARGILQARSLNVSE